MRHVAPVALRWADFDQRKELRDAACLSLLQEARIGFMDAVVYHGRDRGPAEHFVVARLTARYFAPRIRVVHDLTMTMWVTKLGTSSFELAYELSDDDRLLMRASTVNVGFHAGQQKSRPLSDAEREALGTLLEVS